MKDYTNKTPVFSESIRVTETSDPAHADNVNAAPEQLLQNTLVNRDSIVSLAGIVEELLTKGSISVNLVTMDGKQFATADGKVFRAAKRIQFR